MVIGRLLCDIAAVVPILWSSAVGQQNTLAVLPGTIPEYVHEYMY